MSEHNPFDELMTEDEYSTARGQSKRTSQRERAVRLGPPFIKVGRKIFYRKVSVREWLLREEQTPVRSKAAA